MDASLLVLAGVLLGGAAFGSAALWVADPVPGRAEARAFTAIILLIGAGETADRLGVFGRSDWLDLGVIPVLRSAVFLLPPLVCRYAAARIASADRPTIWLFAPAGLAWAAFLAGEAAQVKGDAISRLSWLAFVILAAGCGAFVARMLVSHLDGLKALFSTLPIPSLARMRRLWLVLWLPVLSIAVEITLSQLSVASDHLRFAGACLRVISVLTVIWLMTVDLASTPEPVETAELRHRYGHSALPQDAAAAIAADLRAFMERTAAHRDPLLNLSSLAQQLRVPDHHLSQVLNGTVGQNFYDFVNAYRVAEARRLLEATDQSVLDISLAVGFNARSTFYEAFRRRYGQTPTALRRASPVNAQTSQKRNQADAWP